LEAIAASVAVAEPVERRHLRSGTATLDDRNQVFALELGLTQIGAVGHLVIHLPTITGPSMACLAVPFLSVELAAGGNIGSARRLRLHRIGSHDEQGRDCTCNGYTCAARK